MWCDYRAHYAVVTPKVNTTCVTRMALRNGCNVEAAIGYAVSSGQPVVFLSLGVYCSRC